MEVEELAQLLDVLGARPGQVEPEELVLGHEPLYGLRIDRAEAGDHVGLGRVVLHDRG